MYLENRASLATNKSLDSRQWSERESTWGHVWRTNMTLTRQREHSEGSKQDRPASKDDDVSNDTPTNPRSNKFPGPYVMLIMIYPIHIFSSRSHCLHQTYLQAWSTRNGWLDGRLSFSSADLKSYSTFLWPCIVLQHCFSHFMVHPKKEI